MTGTWSAASTAAYALWAAIPVLPIADAVGRFRGVGGGPRAPEILLAVGFNAAVAALLGCYVLPATTDLGPADSFLVAAPFLAYGIGGFLAGRSRVRGKPSLGGKAVQVYAFSFGGYLIGLGILLGALEIWKGAGWR